MRNEPQPFYFVPLFFTAYGCIDPGRIYTGMSQKVSQISEAVSATCYRTGCTIRLDYAKGKLAAHVSTKTPRPAGSDLPHEVSLQAEVNGNPFGGICIQHTGSCGESTTMLHHLTVCWE